MRWSRRARIDRATIAKLTADNHQLRYDMAREGESLRAIIADLGRRLDAAQARDTVPMPRVRSLTPTRWEAGQPVYDHGADLVAPWAPEAWRQ
jgi:hypothetical protein